MTFRKRCVARLAADQDDPEAREIIGDLVLLVDSIAQAFHDGSDPDGWDVSIMEEVAARIKQTGFAGVGPGFVDPNDWCWDEHIGPVVIAGSEPIDNGVGIEMRCETCGATTDTSVDLDELEWT